jgi:hypothetical protein
MVSTWLLKKNSPIDPALILIPKHDEDERDGLRGIRCPRCAWKPDASSRWCCDASRSPEPFFHGCFTHWNTFVTRGRCPGCAHQWKWTSCLRCHEWSLHEDWYTTDSTPHRG